MSQSRVKMNIHSEEIYDEESDVYYVSFKTGEPSCAVEIDDVLIVEEGVFSGLPTGFRILNFKKNPVRQVQFLISKFKKTMGSAGSDLKNKLRNTENQIEQSLEKVFA